MLGYLKLEEIRKAIRTETLGEVDSIQVENSFYTLDGAETHIYLKSKALNHNHLRADSFRILALFQSVTYKQGVDTSKDFFYAEEIAAAEWFYAVCFNPIKKQDNTKQQFKLTVRGALRLY